MCSKGIAKALLIVFNVIFFLLGAAALAAGVVVLVAKPQLFNLLNGWGQAGTVAESLDSSLLQKGAIALCVGGGVILLIAFLGCCGAIKEVKALLLLYSVIVILILALEIAAGVLAFIFKERVETEAKTFLNTTIAEKYVGMDFVSGSLSKLVESVEPFSAGWDFAHITFDCCGLNTYTDYSMYATKWNRTYSFSDGGMTHSIQAAVPVSCCKLTDKSVWPNVQAVSFMNLTGCLTNADAMYTNRQGCYTSVVDWVKENILIVFGIGIGIAVLEILGIVCGCYLYCKIGKDDD